MGRSRSAPDAHGPDARATHPARPRSTRFAPPRRALLLLAVAIPWLALARAPEARAQGGKLPEGPISEIRFEGNATIPPEKVKVRLLSKVGQAFDPGKIDADVKSLMRTNLFSQVDAYQEESPPKSGKHVLIFVVREMPVLKLVEFRGRTAIRLKEIEDTTLLKKGNRADPTRTRNAVHSILRLYQEKGYDLAEVELIEGGNPGDTKVVIQIFEGPKVKISSIDFVGNQFASDAMLKTHIASRKPILGLFGKYHRDMLDEDRQKLLDYYQGLGFFEAQVTPVTRTGSNPGEVDLTFVVHEGPRYSVRKVIIEGNSKLKTPALMDDLELHSGRPYMMTTRDADKRRLLIKYNEIGCIDTEISVEPRFTDQPGVVDLLYKIDEREPYLLGELEIVGNDRTQDKVIRREAIQAGLLPGEILDGNRIEIFKRRLAQLGYFVNDPEKRDKQIRVEIKRRRPPDEPYGNLMLSDEVTAGADAGPDLRRGAAGRPRECPRRAAAAVAVAGWCRSDGPAGLAAVQPEPVQPAGGSTAAGPAADRRHGAAGRGCARRRGLARRARRPRRSAPRAAPRRDRRAAGLVPQHPRPGHDERRPRPQRPVPEPVVRRHRHLGRGGPNWPLHGQRRGQ